MRELIKKEVANFIKNDFIIESPKDKKLAHFATPIAFSLAKSLKKSPKSIAEDLSTQISSDKFEVCALNGYINFRLKPNFIDELTTFALQNPQNFAQIYYCDRQYHRLNMSGDHHRELQRGLFRRRFGWI